MSNPKPWPADDDVILRQIWEETSDSVTAIALRLHRRQSTVRARAELLGLPPRERRPDILEWNDRQIAILRDRFAAGDSFSQIAVQIGDGCTRNGALGKAHRLGMSRGPDLNRSGRAVTKATPRPPRAPPVKAAPYVANGVNTRVARKPAPAPKPPAKPKFAIHGNGAVIEIAQAPPPLVPMRHRAFEPLPGTSPRPWMDREAGECTWPVGEGLSCCAPIHKRGWCLTHFTVGVVPAKAGQRTPNELARSLRRWAA